MAFSKSNPAVKILAAVLSGILLNSHPAFSQQAQPPVHAVQTSAAGDRLKPVTFPGWAADDNSNLPTITINPAVTRQTIIGFGGAFTESAASVMDKIPKSKRSEILNAYFSQNGSGYTLCRVPIGSCDFSLTSYSYDETPGDMSLSNFSIEHDKALIIPLIKDAMSLSGTSLKILSSPWTPPSWMTTRNALVAKGNHLKKEMYQPYANYLAKYVQAYAGEGITISFMTIQNESWNDSGQWETTQFQPDETAAFVKVLGPIFNSSGIQTKIMIFDHNKGLDNKGGNQVKYYVDRALAGAEARKYVGGIAFHWYGATQTDPFTDIKLTHEAYPEMHLIHTEACAEGGPHPNDYGVGERYGHDIIGCLNHWTEGWIDWNLVLDTTGGPNHAHNLCSAPILADTSTGDLIYNPSYYYLAQISKYFRPGGVVLDTSTSDSTLEAVSCKNPDGKLAVAVMNRTENAIDFKIKYGNWTLKPSIPAHAILTFLF